MRQDTSREKKGRTCSNQNEYYIAGKFLRLMKQPIVSVSILNADIGNLESEITRLHQSAADWIHMDVMDGVFVPNITFGFMVVDAVRRVTSKPLDVHLMIVQPEKYVERFQKVGASAISVHVEACRDLPNVLQSIKGMGCRAGVAINPATPLEEIRNVLPDLDLVILMSVNPGFGGQRFIETTFEKVKALRTMVVEAGSNAQIEVDGGVNMDNARPLMESGADALVVGNFVFSSSDPVETIKAVKGLGK